MIYGDPFKFALQFDVVEEWNSIGSEWRNGLFAMFIDGESIYASIDVVELRTTLGFFKAVPNSPRDCGMPETSASELFQAAHDYFMGDGEERPNGVVSLTCTAMGDVGCCVYLMASASEDRIVWSFDEGLTVSEYVQEAGTVAHVISRASHGAL